MPSASTSKQCWRSVLAVRQIIRNPRSRSGENEVRAQNDKCGSLFERPVCGPIRRMQRRGTAATKRRDNLPQYFIVVDLRVTAIFADESVALPTYRNRALRTRNALLSFPAERSVYFNNTSSGTGSLIVKLPITPGLPPVISTICISAVFWWWI